MNEEILTTVETTTEPTPLELIERAQIDMQIATAKRYPRDPVRVRMNMLKYACLDESTAEACFYTLPRGGKTISGPSVRLAEIAVGAYQNIRTATRCVGVVTTGDSPHCTVQAAFHDLENNVAVCIEKRRRITGKAMWENGKKVGNRPPDEDDINLAVNACSAIAFRDAAFKVIPQALIAPVLAKCREIALGDVKSIVAKRAKVIERLLKMGATLDRVCERVGVRKDDEIDAAKLEILIGLGTALKDGDISLEDAFPAHAEPQQPQPEPARRGRPPGSKNKPQEPTESTPAPAAASTPQQRLADALGAFEITAADFSAWAEAAGHIEAPIADWPELPAEIAERLLRVAKTVANEIVAMKGGAQ